MVHWDDPQGSGGEGGGSGFRMGNTCKSKGDSFQSMAKTTTKLKTHKNNCGEEKESYHLKRLQMYWQGYLIAYYAASLTQGRC